MPRVIDGTRRKDRRKRILKFTKGFIGRRNNLFRSAKDASARALQYAYRDRRTRKRFFRRLWITRISAACRIRGIRYSSFIKALTDAEMRVNRKMLNNLVIEDSESFDDLLKTLKVLT